MAFSAQRNVSKPEPSELKRDFGFFYETVAIDTERQNLTTLDPQLAQFVKPSDFFYVHDLTNRLHAFVQGSGVLDGTLVAQILHTSATLAVNELDEPMLLGDLARKLRFLAPKEEQYLHNGPLRTVNLCEEDTHCDRNADAHVKATLFGRPSVTLIVKDGRLVLGRWQKVALIEFDGPRHREVIFQLSGR